MEDTTSQSYIQTNGRLTRHHWSNTEGKQYAGSFSDKRFSETDSPQNNQEPNAGDKTFSCIHCGKAFSHSGTMIIHMNRHKLSFTEMKKFFCIQCDKSFSQSGHLNSHKLYHRGNNLLACTECGQGFSRSYNLKEHMLAHTREKPFACTQCTKAFSWSSRLKGHMLVHTREKQFTCDKCNKAFSNNGNLKTHKLLHAIPGDKFFSESGHLGKVTHTDEEKVCVKIEMPESVKTEDFS